MALAKLTTKGQVTIPKEIRVALRLRTGDSIEIVVMNNQEAVTRPISKKVDDVFRKLHRPGQNAVSLEDIDRAIGNRMKDST